MAIKIRRQSVGGVQAIPTPNVGVRSDPAAFGAHAAEGIERTGKMFSQIASDVQNRADKAKLLKVQDTAAKIRMEQEHELAQLQGEDAIAAGAVAPEEFNKRLQSEVIQGLNLSERQREAFSSQLARHRRGFQGYVNRKTLSAQEKVAEVSYRSIQQNVADRAASLAADGVVGMQNSDGTMTPLGEERQELIEAVNTRAEQLGLPDEAKEAEMRRALSGMHAQALGAITEGNRWEDAKSYLAAHEDEIEAEQEAEARKLIEAASTRSKARARADDIIEEAKIGDFEIDLDEAFSRAAEIEDLDVRERVEQHIRAGNRDLRATRSAAISEPLGRLREKWISGSGFSRSDPDYANMPDSGQAQFLSWMRAEARRGRAAQNDMNARILNQLYKMPDGEALEVDLATDPRFEGLNSLGIDTGEIYLKRLRDKSGVTIQPVKRAAQFVAERSGFSESRAGQLQGFMVRMYDRYKANNPSREPTGDTIDSWLAYAIEAGEDAGSSALFPGRGQDVLRFESEGEFLPFENLEERFEKVQAAAAAGALDPNAISRLRRRRGDLATERTPQRLGPVTSADEIPEEQRRAMTRGLLSSPDITEVTDDMLVDAWNARAGRSGRR